MPAGVAAVVAMVRAEVALDPGVRLTLVGARVAVSPVAAGETAAVKPTLPVNPRLPAVTVEVAELPATKLAGLAAEAVTVKSAVTVTVTVAVCDRAPLVPVTVTV